MHIIPTKWIRTADMFSFLRTHEKELQGSLLLAAIFEAEWPHKQKLIASFVFAPFMTGFIVVNFYYT